MRDTYKSKDDFACQTLHYYDVNAEHYAEKTRSIDLAHLYTPFLLALPRWGRVLDVGCGAGRDLKYFVESGFEAVGIDPSEKLSAIAREFSGCPVLVTNVQEIHFNQEFDGAWACASLIHLPRCCLPIALRKIFLALRRHGILFISMQIGNGETVTKDGRFVARYNAKELCKAIEQARFELISLWVTPDSLPERSSVMWLNALARKQLD